MTERHQGAQGRQDMLDNAHHAATFLKAMAHEGRLRILCHLDDGEKCVSELEELLDMRQASVSQLLARLREDGIVETRREKTTVYYSISDAKTAQMIHLMHDLFCET